MLVNNSISLIIYIMFQLLPFKIFPSQNAVESGVLDPYIHQKNKAIFAQVISQELGHLANRSNPEITSFLSTHISEIADAAIQKGFDLSIYQYKERPPYLVFTIIPLWEGRKAMGREISLSFMLYAWPPEDIARKFDQSSRNMRSQGDPCHCYYASNIHEHPISCALTVLHGTVTQEIFKRVESMPYRVVRKVGEQVIKKGDSVIDDNSDSFIHRLVCRDIAGQTALTLHGYGAATAKEVENVFNSQPAYLYVLEENGSITKRAW
jgi:hypothetical protein